MMSKFYKLMMGVTLLLGVGSCDSYAPYATHLDPELQTAGYIEEVTVYPSGSRMKAKLDTGAYTASLDARDIVFFEKDSEPWVRFSYINVDSSISTYEARQLSESLIKTHTSQKTVRPVVKMIIELGHKRVESRVNLVNRENFIYPLLLGREFLKDAKIIVNPAESFMLSENKLPKKSL